MKNIENLLNQTFEYDEIKELEDKNKYLLKKVETFKKGIKNLLDDLYQKNHELKLKNEVIELVLNLESLLLENDNKYEKLENLLNQTFEYDEIKELEDKNKYLLKKVETFKKGIKNLLENWKQANYDLEMKNKWIQLFESLEKSESFLEDNDANDNKYEELENLKQKNHELNQKLILKEKQLEDFKIDNKNYEQKILDLNKEKQDLAKHLDTVTQEKQDLAKHLDTVTKAKQDLTDEIQGLNNQVDLLNTKLNKNKDNQLRLNQELDTVTQEKQDLTDELALSQQQLNKVNQTEKETQNQLDKMIYANEDLINQLEESQQQLDTVTKAKQDLTDEIQGLNNQVDLLNTKLNKNKDNQLRLNQELDTVTQEKQDLAKHLDTVTQEKQDLTDTLEESLLIKNSDYYQKLKYISEPIIISKHKNNNWNIETLPNIKDEKIEKTILLNIEENKILNNLIEQKNNITIIFCKKTKKFKEAFFIDKYQNKIIINIENEQQKILEKLNYKIRTEMASSLTQSDINKINNFNNQKEKNKSPCLTKEELKKYQNQGAVPKHYKLV